MQFKIKWKLPCEALLFRSLSPFPLRHRLPCEWCPLCTKTTLPAPYFFQGALTSPSSPEGCTQGLAALPTAYSGEGLPLKGQNVITLKASKASLFQDCFSKENSLSLLPSSQLHKPLAAFSFGISLLFPWAPLDSGLGFPLLPSTETTPSRYTPWLDCPEAGPFPSPEAAGANSTPAAWGEGMGQDNFAATTWICIFEGSDGDAHPEQVAEPPDLTESAESRRLVSRGPLQPKLFYDSLIHCFWACIYFI